MRCLLVVVALLSAVAVEILSDDNIIDMRKNENLAVNELERTPHPERGAALASLVAKKIKRLTKEIFKHVKTDFDKKSLMDQLKTIITDIGRKNHFTAEEINLGAKLILKGIEYALKHKGNHNTIERRSNNDDSFPLKYIIASAASDTTPKILAVKSTTATSTTTTLAATSTTTTLAATTTTRKPVFITRATNKSEVKQTSNNKVTLKSKPKVTKSQSPCLVNEICANIKNLRKFRCSDGSNVDINHLCDGKVHCADGSDERQCMQLASFKIQSVKRILNRLRDAIHRSCFKAQKDTQLEILGSLKGLLKNFRRGGSAVIVNQLAAVNQIAIGLGESFCPQPYSIKTNFIERNEASMEIKGPRTAKLCSCKKGTCRGGLCDRSCKTSCQHRYQLTLWNCAAVDGNKSVSIDKVCDGLPDCNDATDEINCSKDKLFDKFMTRKIQDELIGKIKSKINHKLYLPVTSKLQNLIRFIKEMQPMTSSDNNYNAKEKVKSRRNRVIDALVSVYIELGNDMTSEKIQGEVYRFLKSLSVGVVEITKRQGVFEQRAVVCPCNGAKCALKNCTRLCVRKCAAKVRLRTFDCAGVQLPPSAICNGIPECFDGSDEHSCKLGFCQKYHLIELMRNVDNAVMKYKWTLIGEILDSWLTKFKKNIRSQLNSGMEKRRLLLMLVTDGLEDLVSTYAVMEGRRSSDGPLLEAMEAVSKELKDTLKLCSE